MIKKLSIMMLLMALFAPWAANAQTTVEIGDGTSTSYYTPYNSLYNYSFVEQIYTAEEIGVAGTINSIAFNLSSSDASQTNDFVVYMKNVQRSSFSSDTDYETVTSADIVFSDSFTFNAGWSTLTLTTPFEYDGSSNLLIAFDENSSGYSTRHFYYTNTTNNTVIDHYSDSYDPDPYNLGSYSGYKAIRTNRANIQLNITPAAGFCASPTLNPAEYIEEEQASFSWTENGTATNWVLQYSTSSDFSNATSVNRSGIPAMVISDFDPATTYYVRVKANCGSGDESRWSNVISFSTSCGAITSLPWSEDFNSYSTTATSSTTPSSYPNDILPNCWRFLNRSESSSTYPQVFLSSNSTYAVSGNCLFFKSSNTTPLYAILPEFTNDIAGHELSFTYRNEGTSTSNGTLYVSYMTDPNNASTFNTADAIACAQTTTKTPMKVRFSNAPAGSYLAFKYQGGSSNNYYMAIDDVTVNVPATTTAIQIVNTVSDPTTQMTWDEFAQQVSNGNQFTNTIITLMEDITITSQASQAGTDGKYFSGTFDGNGKTITVNMTATGKYCAPFFGVNNATIKNLVVTGSISSAYQGVGGICGVVYGYTTFTNCVSDVAITSTCNDTPGDANGWSTCGGFVGFSGGGDNPTFVGCAFTGSISAIRNNCGGFIGFHASRSGWSGNYGGRSTFTNCIFAPSSINISNTNNAVFTYGYSNGQYLNITVTNSYYNEAGAQMNVKQNSKQAYSIIGISPVTVAMNGPSTEYNVSGITAHATGLVYGGTIFAGDGDNVALILEGSNSGVYQANHGEITGSENPFTLSMTAHNTEISALNCPAPTGLVVSDINGHGATVSWDKIATQETGDITYNYTWVEHGGTPDWTLHGSMSAFDRWTNEMGPQAFAFGLDPETEYDFYVRRDCGEEGYSAEVMITFTTIVACLAPTDVNVSGITGHEAMVAWTGSSESYIVKYRTAAYMNGVDESFDSGNLPSGWENMSGLLSDIMGGSSLSDSYQWYFGNNNGVFDYHARINIYGTSRYGWLITPEINVGNDFDLNFDLALTAYSGTGAASGTCDDDRFVVLVYADNAWHILREWNNSGSSYVYNDIPTAGQNVNIDLSSYVGKVVKIAFYGESTTTGNGDNNLHIDNVFVGYPVTAGEWQTITVEDTIAVLTGLAPETLYEVVIQGDCGEEGLSTESDPVTFTTDVACPAPVNLTVSDIYAHGATVSWDRVADANHPTVYFQFVCVEHGETPDWTDAPVAIDRPTNPNPPTGFFSGLAPETEYDAYIRRICGTISPSGVIDGEFSDPAIITFTTTVACPAPSEVTVSDITGHGATVTWTGNSEGYEGYYVTIGIDNAPVLQNVDFANGIPSTWNNDASHPWAVVDGHLQNGNSGISSSTSSISVTLTFPADGTIEFDAECRGEGASSYYDHCDFNIDDTRLLYAGANISGWNHYTFDVSAGQHTFTWSYTKDSSVNPTGDYFAIDNIVMKQQPNIVWEDPIFVENTEYTFSGLSSETTYFVTVQSDCGEEGMSSMSDTITFITDISCPAPHDLTTSDVSSNSAMLHWEGDAESYNVSYYKTFFFDSFEYDSEEDFHNLWTVYKVGDDGSTEWIIANPSESSSDLSAHSGITVASSESYPEILTNNWLISPQITLPNQATLKFWIMRSTYDDAQDEYEVLLSTTGNAIDDFTVIKEKVAANSEWTEVSINLSAYDGQQCYIAIRHEFTDGFFLMVDDFGIFGWSEPIATTENSLLIEDLLPETEYQWKVQANCGEEDGLSQWSIVDSFTTLLACPVPSDLTISEITANGATVAWTGYNDSYEIMVGEGLYMAYDFENHTISDDFDNSSSYPWTVVQEGQGGSYCMKSGNGGISNSTSAIEMTVDLVMDATLSFDFWSRGEGSYDTYDWDKSRFYIDGTSMFDYASHSSWESYSTTLTAGTHTLKWEYKKDGSTNPTGDCFYVDNIVIESNSSPAWITYSATESPFILNDATNILPETTYMVKVKGFCGDEETEYSEAVIFTTLDENTKIFVIEGEWSNGDNWVPVGVPTIDENVILRAQATVFDVAEANNITIEGTATLTIEDGGQLKTNSDVTATMKKFIIGYGTDYVETDNGYYLMTLPTVAPVSAADAHLLTEESDYDLYSWDRTATDEEWQNNHDGIDLQNGVGFLYANRDDMEMFFTATLRNSSEPVVVTPAYDEVEHGGWNLCGNPFPCEVYITTDAEGMTFYRLVDNQLELIEGAIAPLEAFFVKASAAGQTFTISREAPAK